MASVYQLLKETLKDPGLTLKQRLHILHTLNCIDIRKTKALKDKKEKKEKKERRSVGRPEKVSDDLKKFLGEADAAEVKEQEK